MAVIEINSWTASAFTQQLKDLYINCISPLNDAGLHGLLNTATDSESEHCGFKPWREHIFYFRKYLFTLSNIYFQMKCKLNILWIRLSNIKYKQKYPISVLFKKFTIRNLIVTFIERDNF